jgi:phosphohistidine phosphatase
VTSPADEKTLLVLRHAKSDWNDPDLEDHDRPLNERGKRDAGRMGRLLREERLVPELIITSTARRARQTVERIVSASGYTGAVVPKRVLYLAGPDRYVTGLSALMDEPQRVMVVGHNPGLEELVEHLTGTATTMPTATLVEIALPIRHWREMNWDIHGELQGVWRPRELR